MPGRAFVTITLALVAGFTTLFFYAKPVMSLPSGFEDNRVVNVPDPTALAFTPDGRMLVTSKRGQLHVFDQDGKALTSPALNLGPKVCSNSERGLLGVAVDPDFEFADRNYVYLYYTYKKFGVCPEHKPANPRNPVNRVSRFVMNGDTVNPDSEIVLIDNIPSPNGNHNAGDVKFGRDEYLYISVGDGGCDYAEPAKCQTESDAARDWHILLGKILRVNRNGGIPPINPYVEPRGRRCNVEGRTVRGQVCQEIFATGLRNPFRMAFDPDSATNFRINDVGAAAWEEINKGRKGADYGWNCREARRVNSRTGKCDPTPRGLVYPVHQYSHNTGCSSITGGAFVPNTGSWPDKYDKSYLFGDFVCGKIFELTPVNDGRGYTRSEFTEVPDSARPIAMTFGPYGPGQALYYTTFKFGGKDQVRRIAYTGGD